jgi:DNA-binding NarL/FixJ family response regulator
MKSDKTYNIIIVDDHALFRNGLKILLNAHESFNVVAEASNGFEFLNALEIVPVDIVLMDISMPEMDGVEATKIALKNHPELKIIALSMFGDEDYYYKMLEAGACGFLLKESEIDEVFTALFNVIEGKSYFSQMLLQNLITLIKNTSEKPEKVDDLSDREIDIISLICQGLCNNEIAEKLLLSKRTVEKHRSNILFKTNSKNTAALVVYAIKNGLVNI